MIACHLRQVAAVRVATRVMIDCVVASLALVLLTLVTLVPAVAATDEPPRLALVVGNAAYTEKPLRNPQADARLMAKALTSVGFEVDLVLDADRAALTARIAAFGQKVRTQDAVALFYFAGHGVQANGRNYILPVDTRIEAPDQVAVEAFELSEILNAMRATSSGIAIAILDSCRDDPLPTLARAIPTGLAATTAPAGTLIAYATGPGRVAQDGRGANSPYTEALAAAIVEPGLSIEQVFKQARKRVIAMTNATQVPWEHSSLVRDFSFADAEPTLEGAEREAASLKVELATLREIEAWKTLAVSEDVGALRRFLTSFPGGAYEEIILHRIARIERQQLDWTSWLTPPDQTVEHARQAERLYGDGVSAERAAADDPAKGGDALRLYRSAADKGLASAAYALGRLYDKGIGTVRDLGEAARWYEKAADARHGPALAALGTMAEFGDGIPRNLLKALRAYQIGAEVGNARAMTSLAYLHATGKGAARDAVEARNWYEKAAALGDTRAQYNLAVMLQTRVGGRADAARARQLLRAAAEKNHPRATAALAYLHDRGRLGLARDPSEAARLFLRAAKLKARNGVSRERGPGVRSVAGTGTEQLGKFSQAMRLALQKSLAADGHFHGAVTGRNTQATQLAIERAVGAHVRP